MKKFFNFHTAPFLTMALGAAGLVAQRYVQQSGIDARGLYISNHPAVILSFLLIPATLGILLLCTWPLHKKAQTAYTPAPSHLYSLLCLLAFGFLLVHSIHALGADLAGWERICAWCKLLTTLLVGLNLGLSLAGKNISYLLQAALTLVLVLIMVCNYRQWSSDPQLLAYFFPLMATSFLLLGSYQRTALAAGNGNSSLFCLFNLGALFFCLMAMPSGGIFFGGMAFWQLASFWSGKPLTKENPSEAA